MRSLFPMLTFLSDNPEFGSFLIRLQSASRICSSAILSKSTPREVIALIAEVNDSSFSSLSGLFRCVVGVVGLIAVFSKRVDGAAVVAKETLLFDW